MRKDLLYNLFYEELSKYFKDYLVFYDDKYKTYILIFKLKGRYKFIFLISSRRFYRYLEERVGRLKYRNCSYILIIL